MPDDTPDLDTQTESALTLTDDTAATFLEELTQSTLDWIRYANQQSQQGNRAETNAAMVTINSQMETLARNQAIIIGGLREVLQKAIEQRDALVHELEEVELQAEFDVEEAFAEGRDSAFSDPEAIWEIENAAIEDHEQEFLSSAGEVTSNLRQAGKDAEADEVDEAVGRAVQSREQAEDLIKKRREEIRTKERAEFFARLGQPDDERPDEEMDEDDLYEGEVFCDEDEESVEE